MESYYDLLLVFTREFDITSYVMCRKVFMWDLSDYHRLWHEEYPNASEMLRLVDDLYTSAMRLSTRRFGGSLEESKVRTTTKTSNRRRLRCRFAKTDEPSSSEI